MFAKNLPWRFSWIYITNEYCPHSLESSFKSDIYVERDLSFDLPSFLQPKSIFSHVFFCCTANLYDVDSDNCVETFFWYLKGSHITLLCLQRVLRCIFRCYQWLMNEFWKRMIMGGGKIHQIMISIIYNPSPNLFSSV